MAIIDRFNSKHLMVIALVLSIVALLSATIGGKDSAADVFVSSLGALGQIWIAAMLYQLARAQFQHQQRADTMYLRSANHAERTAFQDEWQKATNRIGYTEVYKENVAEMARLLKPIRRFFEPATYELARLCHQDAKSALRQAEAVAGDEKRLQVDTAFRNTIDVFKQRKKDCHDAMTKETMLHIA